MPDLFCFKCKQDKPTSEFYVNRQNKNRGFNSYCKECEKITARKRYAQKASVTCHFSKDERKFLDTANALWKVRSC